MVATDKIFEIIINNHNVEKVEDCGFLSVDLPTIQIGIMYNINSGIEVNSEMFIQGSWENLQLNKIQINKLVALIDTALESDSNDAEEWELYGFSSQNDFLCNREIRYQLYSS